MNTTDEFQFDESEWPIVVIGCPAEVTDAGLAVYLKRLSSYADKRLRYGVVMDASQTKLMSPQQRLEMSNYLRNNRVVLGQYCVGTTFVITNMVVKGMLSAIMMFTPLPYSHKVVGSRDAGKEWLREQMAASDLKVRAR